MTRSGEDAVPDSIEAAEQTVSQWEKNRLAQGEDEEDFGGQSYLS
jgi:hypothetical protein